MVDVCLIPEVKFELDALTAYVRQVMRRKGYCVVCIAEGAGQEIMQHGQAATDKSGNPILRDIGTHLRDFFKESMKVCWSNQTCKKQMERNRRRCANQEAHGLT